MGNPRRQRKKYSKPFKRWDKERIEKEKSLMKEYGLKNKKEIWKIASKLKGFKYQARRLVAKRSEQAEIEKRQLLAKLYTLGLLDKDAKLDDVLSLTENDLLERRLQTQVVRVGLARSIKQARQFITHEHIMVGDKVVNIPSYLVKRGEEQMIKFKPDSPFSNEEHPIRISKKEEVKEVKKE